MGHLHPLEGYRLKQSPPLSKAELARALGVSRSYLHRVLVGERKIGASKLSGVSDKTGIPKRELRPDLAELLEGRE